VARLDIRELGKLLKLVIDWDHKKVRGGELAKYNNLHIAVPGLEEYDKVRCGMHCCSGLNVGVRVGCWHR
jgi:hypothetical protein